jgi:anti-sigma-K factor RskA
MTDPDFQELVALCALGALEPAQMARVEAHLKNNPQAQAILFNHLESVALLAQAVPIHAPPPNLKSKLARRIRSHQKLSFLAPVWFGKSFWTSSVATVFVFGLMLSVVGLQHTQTLQANRQMRRLEALLAASQTKVFLMQSLSNQAVVGRVFLAADRQLFISHTMGLEKAKTWQAWYIKKGQSTPISLGTTADSHLLIRLSDDAAVVAVSEEPLGGSKLPTLIRGVAKL